MDAKELLWFGYFFSQKEMNSLQIKALELGPGSSGFGYQGTVIANKAFNEKTPKCKALGGLSV